MILQRNHNRVTSQIITNAQNDGYIQYDTIYRVFKSINLVRYDV